MCVYSLGVNNKPRHQFDKFLQNICEKFCFLCLTSLVLHTGICKTQHRIFGMRDRIGENL